MPEPPAWLSGEALAEWGRVVPELHRLGLLSPLDRAILSVYCHTWETWCRAQRDLAAGLTAPGRRRSEVVKTPAWMVARQAATLLLPLARELGVSPAARLRMPVREPDPEPDDLD